MVKEQQPKDLFSLTTFFHYFLNGFIEVLSKLVLHYSGNCVYSVACETTRIPLYLFESAVGFVNVFNEKKRK